MIVPLRLGLSEINPIYINALKKTFEIPGTVGIVGGRPNQALYFIGYVGDEALYLDPHTTQKSGSVGDKLSQNEVDLDDTYHQRFAARINFKNMDPSVALVSVHCGHGDGTQVIDSFRFLSVLLVPNKAGVQRAVRTSPERSHPEFESSTL